MIIKTLNGEWTLERVGGEEKGTAIVPGDIYKDLLYNRMIEKVFLS